MAVLQGFPESSASRWGPLRFVGSMNVFPTSLASMTGDLVACTHKQLPELFPLMLASPDAADSPPQRRPLKQRRDSLRSRAGVELILRELPMPFEHFCGADAWEKPWKQHATTACGGEGREQGGLPLKAVEGTISCRCSTGWSRQILPLRFCKVVQGEALPYVPVHVGALVLLGLHGVE